MIKIIPCFQAYSYYFYNNFLMSFFPYDDRKEEKVLNRNIKKLLKELTPRDFEALKSIYDFRCLSLDQIYDRHYKYSQLLKKEVTKEYLKKKIIKFKRNGIIEEVDMYKKIPNVYFLTMKGIKLLKEYYDFPDNIYDINKRIHRRGYLTYNELILAERQIPHQYNLNEFVLNILKEVDVPTKYEGEKHIKEFVGIRPDGILTMYDIDFFLEMDMGTETTKQLNEKWDHYRSFVNSNEFVMKERKIVILFIVDGIKRIGQRIDLIKDTINNGFIDLVNKDVEIYVNTKDELKRIVLEKIIPQTKNANVDINKLKSLLSRKFGYNIASGSKVAAFFGDTDYFLYIRKESDAKRDFIVEEFFGEPLSTINRIAFWQKQNAIFREKTGRMAKMIVVCDSEESIFKNLRSFDLFNTDNVVFTTISRLENNDNLPYALFNITPTGEIFRYEDEDLNKRSHEKTLKIN